MTDVDGKRYLDFLAGYSALNFGHRHPDLIAAAHAQLDRLTLTSRAFIHDQFAEFCRRPRRARRQGHGAADEHRRRGGRDRDQGRPQVGLPGQGRPAGSGQDHRGRPGNFHGRTTTIVSFSDDPRRPRRLRALHPGLRHGAVRRPRRPRRSDRRRHGRRAASSRSRARPACSCRRTATWPACASSAPPTTSCCIADEIQSRPRPHRRHLRLRPRGRRARHVPAGQGARRRHRAGLAPSSAATRRARRAQARRARLHLRRQPARLRRRHARSSSCCETGEFQARGRELGEHLHAGLAQLIGAGRDRRPRSRAVGRRRHRPGR